MSKIYHPDCKSLITSMYVKNGLIAILFLIASIFGVVVMQEWKILLIGLMCAAYFIFQIYEIHNDEKNERYKTVKGIVVSDESSKNMIRQQISTYRIIPVNEDGEFIDKNGKYDFFLSVNESKKNVKNSFFVGAMYDFIFKSNEDGVTAFNDRNLVTCSRVTTAVKNDDTIVPADTQKSAPSMSRWKRTIKSNKKPKKKLLSKKRNTPKTTSSFWMDLVKAVIQSE